MKNNNRKAIMGVCYVRFRDWKSKVDAKSRDSLFLNFANEQCYDSVNFSVKYKDSLCAFPCRNLLICVPGYDHQK